MNKYIRAAICLAVTDIKFAYLKILDGKRFKASPLSFCSPFTEFQISHAGGYYI